MGAVAALVVWEEPMNSRMLFAILLLLNGTVIGADIPELLPQGAFVEELRDSARISAPRVVTGVRLVASDGETGIGLVTSDVEAIPSAHAKMPGGWKGETICARWLSSDARYEAWSEYVLSERGGLPPDWSRGPVQLLFKSKHKKLLQALPPDRIGITVTKGACDAPSSVYVPVIWKGAEPLKGDTVVVLVHARGADEVYLILYPDKGREKYIDCSQLDHEYRVSIDHKCEIPPNDFKSGRLKLTLNRLRRGLPDDPVEFEIEIQE
jgi:hypothetical protein